MVKQMNKLKKAVLRAARYAGGRFCCARSVTR
jgi:hypothetical protein